MALFPLPLPHLACLFPASCPFAPRGSSPPPPSQCPPPPVLPTLTHDELHPACQSLSKPSLLGHTQPHHEAPKECVNPQGLGSECTGNQQQEDTGLVIGAVCRPPLGYQLVRLGQQWPQQQHHEGDVARGTQCCVEALEGGL